MALESPIRVETTNQIEFEPERYELRTPVSYHFALGRREFFRILGGGIVIACVLKDSAALTGAVQESGARRGGGFGERLPQEISAWLHIGEDGVVTVFTGKVEVGQNARTALTQAVAEELRVSPRDIRMVMGDTDLTPFDMGTFGSRTTPTMNPQLRRASAAALDVLMGFAADDWKVDRSKLTAADGKITDPASARTISYADLVKGKQIAQAIPAEDPLVPASRWTVMGESLPKVDGVEFVTGKHQYPSDIALPGMLHGKVLRPTSFGATLGTLDTHEAEAMPGVTVVHDGDFVGVAAPSVEIAARALAAIHVEWKPNSEKPSPAPQPSSRDLFDYLRKNPDESSGEGGFGGRSDHQAGSVEKGLADADQHLRQTYTIAYIAHAPLEPRAAVAQWENGPKGKLTVWTGTQRPFGVRGELMEAFRLSEGQVRVEMPDTGSGYGGKHTGDAAVEAARLAKTAGKPVKLVWTREEEFTWAYFRPAGVVDVAGGARNDGTLTAWEFHNYNSGGSGIGTPYDVANQHIQFHPTKSPLRQGSYRALAATANHFVRESFMDELAHAVKMDPLEFRLKNLKDERLKAVFEAAAQKFGWSGSKSESGHGFGLGGGVEKGGYVATCAEVAVDRGGQVKIVRVVTAFDCGAVVNPDQLRNQIEGANVMGIGGALFEAIEFEDGQILNGRFSQYRVPRFNDVPQIEVVLVDRKDQPSAGAGETPIVGLAPAVGNAIFAATGVRLRSLPMAPNGVKV